MDKKGSNIFLKIFNLVIYAILTYGISCFVRMSYECFKSSPKTSDNIIVGTVTSLVACLIIFCLIKSIIDKDNLWDKLFNV